MDLRFYLPSYRHRREQIRNVALQTLLSLFGRALGPAPRHNTRRFTDTTENFTLSLTYYSLITHSLTYSLTPSLTHSLAPVRAEQSRAACRRPRPRRWRRWPACTTECWPPPTTRCLTHSLTHSTTTVSLPHSLRCVAPFTPCALFHQRSPTHSLSHSLTHSLTLPLFN